MSNKNNPPVFRLTILNYDHFPTPIHKEDIIIFSDKNEQVFKSIKDLEDMIKELEKLDIKYKVKVE